MSKNSDDLEITEEDYIETYIIQDKEDPKVQAEIAENRKKFISICSKEELTEENFIELNNLYSSSLYNDKSTLKGEDFSKFAYLAIEQAMILRSPKAIKTAIILTETIINNDLKNAISFKQGDTSLLQKYRADIDDVLYMSFKDPKATGRINIDYKLYPQASIKQSAFSIIRMTENKKQQAETGSALDTPLGQNLVQYSETPNQGQLNYIMSSINPTHMDAEDEWRINQMAPKKLGDKNAKDQFLITTGKNDKLTSAGDLHETDLSKYQGSGPAELAMKFSNNYQFKALQLGVSPEEALKQNSETLILTLHKEFSNKAGKTYTELPDNFQERLGKLASNIASLPFKVISTQPQISAPSNAAKMPNEQPIIEQKPQLTGNATNYISDAASSPNKTSNNTPTIGQIAFGAAVIGAMAMGAKTLYNYYQRSFGKDATEEQINHAKTLLATLPKDKDYQTTIYEPIVTFHNNLASKLNDLYDQGKKSTQEYKLLREEVDLAYQNKEAAYELGERIAKLKQDSKGIIQPNLKENYVSGLIKEFQALEEIANEIVTNVLLSKMKRDDIEKQKTPKSPAKHAKRVKEEREEIKTSSLKR